MRIAIRDTYKALQPLKFCMQVRWGCAALSQERAAFSQASKAMLVFREISLMLCNRALARWLRSNHDQYMVKVDAQVSPLIMVTLNLTKTLCHLRMC